MVKQVTKFRTSDGSDFECDYEAWKHELKLWLILNGADNEAIATKIVKSVDDGRPETLSKLGQIVAGLVDTAPLVTIHPPAAPLYRIPDLTATRARCMVGVKCFHTLDTCTSDPDYQRYLRAKKLYDDNQNLRTSITPPIAFNQIAPDRMQYWLHCAETGSAS